MQIRHCLLLFPFALCSGTLSAAVDFNRDIRPIISNRCFKCHGPDQNERKAGLRFDTRAGALAELKGGRRAIVPGKPALSELIRRVTTSDSDDRMPPEKSGKPLTKDEITKLTQWIEQGAAYAQHWSYERPARPKVPANSNKDWATNDIDRFLMARLEKEGLKP